MDTTVYFIRHSEPIGKSFVENIENNNSLQIWNEKMPLSIDGEAKAKALSELSELQNLDQIFSSNYVRAISTAKYIANQNNLTLKVVESFGERKFGVFSWNELPINFTKKQIEKKDFKTKHGESRREVTTRMYNALIKILNNHQGERIAITSHATALTFLFMHLCTYENNKVVFNNQVIIDETFKWNAPELFELKFNDNNELVSIKNIRQTFQSKPRKGLKL